MSSSRLYFCVVVTCKHLARDVTSSTRTSASARLLGSSAGRGGRSGSAVKVMLVLLLVRTSRKVACCTKPFIHPPAQTEFAETFWSRVSIVDRTSSNAIPLAPSFACAINDVNARPTVCTERREKGEKYGYEPAASNRSVAPSSATALCTLAFSVFSFRNFGLDGVPAKLVNTFEEKKKEKKRKGKEQT